jgi:hypothetical protein
LRRTEVRDDREENREGSFDVEQPPPSPFVELTLHCTKDTRRHETGEGVRMSEERRCWTIRGLTVRKRLRSAIHSKEWRCEDLAPPSCTIWREGNCGREKVSGNIQNSFARGGYAHTAPGKKAAWRRAGISEECQRWPKQPVTDLDETEEELLGLKDQRGNTGKSKLA